jgi:hypothetical protein
MKTIITIFISICLATFARSQTDSSGELQGRVFDQSTNEGIPFAAVILEQDGAQKGLGQTDDNGNYTIKSLPSGSYELRVQYLGYSPIYLTGINIMSDRITFQSVLMQLTVPNPNASAQGYIRYVNCTPARSSTIDQHAITLSADSSNQISTSSISCLNVSSCRSGSTQYVVDGIPIRCGIGLPANAFEDITVITGGLRAKYENATSLSTDSVLKMDNRFPFNEFVFRGSTPFHF